MATFFRDWMDHFALASAFFLTLILTIINARRATRPLRKGVLFALLFGPSTLVVAFCCHEANILYDASVRMSEKTFVYDYRFYSLILMGVLLATLSLQLLRKTIGYYVYKTGRPREYFYPMAMIVLTSAPTIPFTPIGALPAICCLILLAASPFVVKPRPISKQSRVIEVEDALTVLERATI